VFFVEARYHRSPERAAGQVRYIAHREEGLTDGRSRELYGIGDQYRALRGDESAIRRALWEDGRHLRSPVYFRFILTVDNPTAARFTRLDGRLSARVLRDAIDKTFRGSLRGVQGVFAVHEHGGINRPVHPHVHAVLSPRFENGMTVHIAPARIRRVRERWEREILAGLQRQERRLERMRYGLERTPERPSRTPADRIPVEVLRHRVPLRRGHQLELFAHTKSAIALARSDSLARRWLLFGGSGSRWERDPEKAARRAAFRLASKAMPQPIRDALWLLRGLREIGRSR